MRQRGFTLIELIIVIVIVAILLALAIPAYTDYVRRSRRTEAMSTLQEMQLRQEQWRTNNPAYSATLLPGAGASSHYTFTIPTATATRYVLRAVATGDQQKDTGCTTLEIEFNAGVTTKRPNPDTPNCWRRN
ncbi:MAG TPA: type IV pilin protein [Xanthomonadales bacterium]|nr:type IV pilin protein [Xanthomonadales bacterium]